MSSTENKGKKKKSKRLVCNVDISLQNNKTIKDFINQNCSKVIFKIKSSNNEKTSNLNNIKPSKKNILSKDFDLNYIELKEFLRYYTKNYRNFYSDRFKHLDSDRNKVNSQQIYLELLRKTVQRGQVPHIVYEIYDKETGWIRVGWSSHSPDERMNWYILRAFSPQLLPEMANIYHEMAKCKSKKQALSRFIMKVRYIYPSKGEAQIMEEFLK